jgi:hypothetical protein
MVIGYSNQKVNKAGSELNEFKYLTQISYTRFKYEGLNTK